MDSLLIQQFVEHPRRTWIVVALAITLGVVVGLPVYDRNKEVHAQSAKLLDELEEAKRVVAQLHPLQQKLAQVVSTCSNQNDTINEDAAKTLREESIKVVRERESRLLRATLSEPHTRAWADQDDPMVSTAPKGAEKSKFQLVTSRLNLSIEGTLANLAKVLKDLTKLHEMAVPTRMTLRREGDREELHLEIELTLLHLLRKSA